MSRPNDERFRSILSQMAESYFETDLAGNITLVNTAACKNLGWHIRDLIGANYRNFLTKQSQQRIFEIFNHVYKTGNAAQNIETEILRKDGSLSLQEMSVCLLRDAKGEPTGFFCISRDRTEEILLQRALRESEESYRRVMELAPDAITISRATDGKYYEVNEAFCQQTGYRREEVIGRTVTELNLYTTPEDRNRLLDAIRIYGRVSGMEITFQARDGTTLNDLVSGRIIQFKGVECVLIVATLINDLKKAQKIALENEALYRTILNTAPDAIYLKDHEMKYTLVNPAMERVYGLQADDFIGRTDQELFGRQFTGDALPLEASVLKGEIIEHEEIRWVAGIQKSFHSIKVPLMDSDGKVTGLCGFARDLTTTKQLEAQLLQAQKMEAIGTLAGGVAHDFNNLLQAILGYAQMLLLNKEREETEARKLREIEKAAQRATELTQRLLTFGRKVEIKARPVDVNQVVKQVEQLLERTIPKMIHIELRLSPTLLTVNADPVQLEQVLLNIGVNARDAMPEGGKLIIETANVKPDEVFRKVNLDEGHSDYILLSITDTGHGIPAEVLAHIFEPFFTTKKIGEGTGLGLAMAYGIIKKHQGHIDCQSSPGMGTCFRIYLPAIQAIADQEIQATEAPIEKGRGETVLVVDDEVFLRELATEMLSQNGYKVITAGSGEEALRLYRQHQKNIALILLDLIMPGMGGKQCLAEMLKINPQVNVLIASGYTLDEPKSDPVLIKAKGYVPKPYNLRVVLQCVREIL